MTDKIKIGTTVKWGSQAGGFWTEKIGKVVAIVPPMTQVNERLRRAGENGRLREPGMARDHESYVVRIGSKLYWPRVSSLSEAKAKK
jgi:hypothetical protein